MSVTADPPARRGLLARLWGSLFSLFVGALLCLTAPTSLIALGWIMRRMRFVALRKSGISTEAPGWVLGRGKGVSRLVSGLAQSIREGIMAATSMSLAAAPFAVIWLLSWWAGWENSFSKGYEQAFVGPLLGLVGVAIFCVVMIWFPLALAHQAVENRALALFEWRKVRSAVRHTGWGYFALALATVFLALPVFAGRGLVTFASGIVPGFDEMTTEDIASMARTIDLVLAAYVFAALVFLRSWSARIYASAMMRALSGSDADLWQDSRLFGGQLRGQRSWKVTHWVRLALISMVWFGLAAQIFVAQFLNHDWHLWITHPFFLLPWTG